MKTRLLFICAILGLFPLTSALSAEEGRSAGLARQVLSQLTDNGAFSNKLVQAALKRTFSVVRYVPAYVSIPYPNGDVPETTGVCTDEIIRVYRAVGVDLQQSVHEDMKANFREYPSAWGLSHTDTNIDHRRVPNLQKFFERM